MRADKRAERLYRTLDASLRVRAILRRWKAGRKPDPLLLYTMPKGQVHEFNRLCRLVTRVTNSLITRALVVRQCIPQLEQELVLLNELRIRAAEREIVSLFVRTFVPEPITRQEYRRRDQGWRREADGDKQRIVSTGDVLRRQRASEVRRFRADRTRDVPQLLASLRVLRESAFDQGDDLFDEWLDDPPVPMPDGAGYFEVYPDSDGAAVRRGRQLLQAVQEILASNDSAILEERVADRLGGEFDLLWHELRRIEIVADGFAREEFAGEDPLKPWERQVVEEAKSKLLALREALEAHGVRVEATEPPAALVQALRNELAPQEGLFNAVVVDVRGNGRDMRPPAQT